MPNIDDLLNQSLMQLSEEETWELVDGYDISTYYTDEQSMVEIDALKRTIDDLSENVSVFEENNAQYVTFVCDRYLDGIDLSTKLFNVQYENKSNDIWGTSKPVNFYRSSSRIKFGWIINNVATQKPITLNVIVFCIGKVGLNDYVFKTRPIEYTIYNSSEIGGGEEHKPDDSWYIQFVIQQEALVNESKGYRDQAQQYANSANSSMLSALESEDLSRQYANSASQSANIASSSAETAEEDAEACEYYYQQTQAISPTYDGIAVVNSDTTPLTLSNSKPGAFNLTEIDGKMEQDADPTPENPQAIKKVTVSKVKVTGKNILNSTLVTANTKNGITCTPQFDVSGNLIGYQLSGTATAKADFQLHNAFGSTDVYIQSGTYKANNAGAINRIELHNGYGTDNYTVANGNTDTEITCLNGISWTILRVENGTVINTPILVQPMIRLATETDPTFEPYRSTTITLPDPIDLYGTDDVKDVLFRDSDGLIKVNRAWAVIASYNGETITTDYMSTTGQLTTGAEVVYQLATPTTEVLSTADQIALNSIPTYDTVTYLELLDTEVEPEVSGEYGVSKIGGYTLAAKQHEAITDAMYTVENGVLCAFVDYE